MKMHIAGNDSGSPGRYPSMRMTCIDARAVRPAKVSKARYGTAVADVHATGASD